MLQGHPIRTLWSLIEVLYLNIVMRNDALKHFVTTASYHTSASLRGSGVRAWSHVAGLGREGPPLGAAERKHHAPPAAQHGEGAGFGHRHQGQGGESASQSVNTFGGVTCVVSWLDKCGVWGVGG